MNLFQLGDFTLNSGVRSQYKLECDALTNKDIETLAFMIAQIVGPFSSVEGVPQGGLRLVEALCELSSMSVAAPHLIVDDVLTTGRSMERALSMQPGRMGIGAVIFARGKCPPWVKPLFQMAEELWI